MKKKVLVVCIGGTVRSVAIKDMLNSCHNCDALAASAISQSPETMRMLCDWADLIVPVEPRELPRNTGSSPHQEKWGSCVMWSDEWAFKLKVLDIGPDKWGNARHPELSELIRPQLAGLIA